MQSLDQSRPDPLPEGLIRCPVCGEARGKTPDGRLSVCYCEGVVCNWCGYVSRRPITDYFSSKGSWVHVPYFTLKGHAMECTAPPEQRVGEQFTKRPSGPDLDAYTARMNSLTLAGMPTGRQAWTISIGSMPESARITASPRAVTPAPVPSSTLKPPQPIAAEAGLRATANPSGPASAPASRPRATAKRSKPVADDTEPQIRRKRPGRVVDERQWQDQGNRYFLVFNPMTAMATVVIAGVMGLKDGMLAGVAIFALFIGGLIFTIGASRTMRLP